MTRRKALVEGIQRIGQGDTLARLNYYICMAATEREQKLSETRMVRVNRDLFLDRLLAMWSSALRGTETVDHSS